MQRHTTIQISIRLLLDRKLNAAAYGTTANFFCPAIRRFHDPRASAGHDGKTEPRERRAHLARQIVIRTIGFDAGGAEDGDARADKMQNAKSSQKIARHAQYGNELVEPRPRTFEKNLIGALRRRSRAESDGSRVSTTGIFVSSTRL